MRIFSKVMKRLTVIALSILITLPLASCKSIFDRILEPEFYSGNWTCEQFTLTPNDYFELDIDGKTYLCRAYYAVAESIRIDYKTEYYMTDGVTPVHYPIYRARISIKNDQMTMEITRDYLYEREETQTNHVGMKFTLDKVEFENDSSDQDASPSNSPYESQTESDDTTSSVS